MSNVTPKEVERRQSAGREVIAVLSTQRSALVDRLATLLPRVDGGVLVDSLVELETHALQRMNAASGQHEAERTDDPPVLVERDEATLHARQDLNDLGRGVRVIYGEDYATLVSLRGAPPVAPEAVRLLVGQVVKQLDEHPAPAPIAPAFTLDLTAWRARLLLDGERIDRALDALKREASELSATQAEKDAANQNFDRVHRKVTVITQALAELVGLDDRIELSADPLPRRRKPRTEPVPPTDVES